VSPKNNSSGTVNAILDINGFFKKSEWTAADESLDGFGVRPPMSGWVNERVGCRRNCATSRATRVVLLDFRGVTPGGP
jgi:hypothetical protein